MWLFLCWIIAGSQGVGGYTGYFITLPSPLLVNTRPTQGPCWVTSSICICNCNSHIHIICKDNALQHLQRIVFLINIVFFLNPKKTNFQTTDTNPLFRSYRLLSFSCVRCNLFWNCHCVPVCPHAHAACSMQRSSVLGTQKSPAEFGLSNSDPNVVCAAYSLVLRFTTN